MHTALSPDLSRRLLEALDQLATDGNLAYVALVDASGTTLKSAGNLPARCGAQEIITLATTALATTGTQDQPTTQVPEEGLLRKHSGHSLYTQPLGGNFILLSVGKPTVRGGLVRIASRLHATVVEEICREIVLTGAAERSPEAGLRQSPKPWLEFDRVSVNDLLCSENQPSGGFLRLHPGDIDTALLDSTSGDTQQDEESGSQPPSCFRHVFSRILTGQASR